MRESFEILVWSTVGVLLVALAVPWFLWGESETIAGLPVWVWWHVAWLCVTAVAFHVFTRTSWGVGIEAPGGEVDG